MVQKRKAKTSLKGDKLEKESANGQKNGIINPKKVKPNNETVVYKL